MNSQWKKYTGSDEQIAELNNCKNGLLAKNYLGYIWPDIYEHFDFAPIGATHYLICDPHPYAEMICQWARTGQPVYVKVSGGIVPNNSIFIEDELIIVMPEYFIIKTNKPNWNIPNVDYSFTPFEEEV